MINLLELISKDAPISGKLRIHYSREPVDQIKDKTDLNQADAKPKGFWYGFGREWINYVETDHELSHKRGKYIYFVKVHNLKRVLQLNGLVDIFNFTKQYSDKWRGQYWLINWPKVTKHYAGIEINPHSTAAQHYARNSRELEWYRDWDVASGCMWDVSNISTKLIFPRQTHDKP